MRDNSQSRDFFNRFPHLADKAVQPADEKGRDAEEEDSCSAFGYLRGLESRAMAIEFRFRDGNSETYPYTWLGPWKYNPSAGLMLKFSGDVVTLVVIRGSNLDALLPERGINLTDRGLQRHRITYVREMADAELRRAGRGEPTIDRIELAEFDSQEEMREWIKKNEPRFLRPAI
ncbi:MAG TPA: hypothetical protein VK395_29140 [Gemmataceae bacterium]|nr:hypothetical protein [Gemmataceae bacterium]